MMLNFLLVIVLLPIYVFVIRRPLFFAQERVGKGGDLFRAYKFCTMQDNDSDIDLTGGAKPKAFVNMLYLTLRRSHLDEIPQVLNVYKADMSLIGPRPYTVDETERLSKVINEFGLRSSIKPGITGLAQINYDHRNIDESAQVKFDLDISYITNASLLLDIRIATNTVFEICRYRGI